MGIEAAAAGPVTQIDSPKAMYMIWILLWQQCSVCAVAA